MIPAEGTHHIPPSPPEFRFCQAVILPAGVHLGPVRRPADDVPGVGVFHADLCLVVAAVETQRKAVPSVEPVGDFGVEVVEVVASSDLFVVHLIVLPLFVGVVQGGLHQEIHVGPSGRDIECGLSLHYWTFDVEFRGNQADGCAAGDPVVIAVVHPDIQHA